VVQPKPAVLLELGLETSAWVVKTDVIKSVSFLGLISLW